MRKQLIISALLLCGTAANAQSVLNSTGGYGMAGGNTFEYALGDVVAGTTLSSSSLVVTQGVLQPGVATTGIHPIPTITGLQVFPSPVSSTLYLQPDLGRGGVLHYELYDAAGRLVIARNAALQTGNERQEMDVHSLAVGQYMLQVQWQSGAVNSAGAYKIQKLQ